VDKKYYLSKAMEEYVKKHRPDLSETIDISKAVQTKQGQMDSNYILQFKRQSNEIREYKDECFTITKNWGEGGGNTGYIAQALQTDGQLRTGCSWGTNNPQSKRNIRRLTPKECERLQGFLDDWTEGVSDTQRYKQMGNAVSVPVIEAIGRRMLEIL